MTNWTTPRTWVDSEIVSASLLNTHVRDDLNYLKEQSDASNTLNVSAPATTNSGAGETDLWTYTLAAGRLSADGMGLRLTALYTTTNNANVKTLKFYFGGTAFTVRTVADNSKTAHIEVLLWRTGALAQFGTARAMIDAVGSTSVVPIATTFDMTTSLALKLTGQATSTNDMVLRGVLLEAFG